MKALRFLPLAFVAGIDGFNLFAPYLAAVMAVAPVVRWLGRRRSSAKAARTMQSPAATLLAEESLDLPASV